MYPLVKVHHRRGSAVDLSLVKRSRRRVDGNLLRGNQLQGVVTLDLVHGIGIHNRTEKLQNLEGTSRSRKTVDLDQEVVGRGLRAVVLNLGAAIQDLEAVNHHLEATNRGRTVGREREKCPQTFERAEE